MTTVEDRRAYHRAYYRDNREKYETARTARRQARYDYINARKDAPCTDCTGRFPSVCMQFDHVRGTKVKDLSNLAAGCSSFERIQAEIDKCELVCANCHFIRSATRGGWHGAPVS